MSRPSRPALISAWLGFALAALLLYPLAVALDSGIYYLQWQRDDAVEAIAALVILSLVFGVVVHILWTKRGVTATVALTLVAALPLMSFAAGVSRQVPFGAALRAAWESQAIRFGAPAAVALIGVILLVGRPGAFDKVMRLFLTVLSPVSLVVVGSIIRSGLQTPPVVEVARELPPSVTGNSTRCASVLALLFDELSFAYLYDGADVSHRFPAIRQFADSATNYMAVSAPGGETLTSMPGYLTGRRDMDVRIQSSAVVELTSDGKLRDVRASEPGGLFGRARQLGYGTEMAGYYFAYCDLLGPLVDRCRSLSFYNMSATDDSFSPADPILTALIMWPRQFPFGVIKNMPFARLQHDIVEETRAFAEDPIDPSRAVFRFVHFSVPHLPFVFTADGYDPPLDPLRTSPDAAYVRQIEYVDRLVAEIVGRMKKDGTYDRTTIVILADHGFRFGGRETDPRHIPFIVKAPGQHTDRLVSEARRAESLLPHLLERSCAAGL